MQDKEMDGLFRSKLEQFEMEPSANVWPGIAAELDPPKKKISLASFLSVAASIVVLVGAGLLFIPKKGVVKHKGQPLAVITKTAPAINRVPAVNTTPQATASPVKTADINNMAIAQYKKHAKTGTITAFDTAAKPALNIQSSQQQVIAYVPQNQQPAKAVVPDNSTPLIAKQAPDQGQAYSTQPQIAALPVIAPQKDTAAVKPRHGIHSFGELVNVLVAKVDKRRDKVIEFSADDDGESHITGVNLGIIKIKKRE